MKRFSLLAALGVLASVAACDTGPKPTPTATGPIALPGERPANAALSTPPDEWAAPLPQTARAVTARP